MDVDSARGDCAGDRIDQKRHVVIDHRQPHPAMTRLAAARGQLNRGIAWLAPRGDLGDERRRFVLLCTAKAVEFAWEGIRIERVAQQADDLLVRARRGSHGFNRLAKDHWVQAIDPRSRLRQGGGRAEVYAAERRMARSSIFSSVTTATGW